MNISLSRKQRQQLLDWAERAGKHECCGLLLGKDNVVEMVELTVNVAEDTERHFEIDPSALIAAEKHARRGGPQVLGYFHSHPDGSSEPSATDAAAAAADGRRWLIIANGRITSWHPIGNGIERPVIFGLEGIVEA